MNTIDVKGDAQTFKEIIEGTISEFADDAITHVRYYAFYKNSNLMSIDLPNVASVSENAFAKCEKLANANIPLVERINTNAFAECGIINITLPQLSILGDAVFEECYDLVGVSAPKLTVATAGAFAYCSSLESVYMPSIKTIQSRAFSKCSNLREIRLSAIERISSLAFARCIQLVSVYLLNSSVAELGNSTAFSSTPMQDSSYTGSFGSIYVPASLVDSYKSASGWSYYKNRITAYEE